jgi:hypothetical protein
MLLAFPTLATTELLAQLTLMPSATLTDAVIAVPFGLWTDVSSIVTRTALLFAATIALARLVATTALALTLPLLPFKSSVCALARTLITPIAVSLPMLAFFLPELLAPLLLTMVFALRVVTLPQSRMKSPLVFPSLFARGSSSLLPSLSTRPTSDLTAASLLRCSLI